MRELAGRVAVVTGAASGIGRALADRLAAEGMKVALADVDEGRLGRAAAALRARGSDVLAVPTDVSRTADVEALARETLRAFGAVHLLVNNAGVVSPPAPAWEKRPVDWDFVLGVNLGGVINGIRAFLPALLEQEEAHVVNTASAAGLMSLPFGADYLASKHAVVSISESLHLELAELGARVKVSVLCPGFVRTRILDAAAERAAGVRVRPELAAQEEEYRRLIAEATPPEEIADHVVRAVREERFWVFPHADVKPYAELRLRAVLEERDPTGPEP